MNKPLLPIPMTTTMMMRRSDNSNGNDDNKNDQDDHRHRSDGGDGDRSIDLSGFTTEEKLSWLGGYDLWNLRALPPGLIEDDEDDENEDEAVTAAATTARSSSSSSSLFSSMRSSLRKSSTARRRTPVQPPKTTTTSLRLHDGPHGVRKPLGDFSLRESHPATCFPPACASACSWNPALVERMGRALSVECELYEVDVLLGPGINLKRNPRGGRNHEYWSEDPTLTGILAERYVGGVQESGSVGACLKHFCLNNQESNRFVVDVVVDERTMRELYLPAFERSLSRRRRRPRRRKSDDNDDDDDRRRGSSGVPKLVMAAYNKVNGTYCCESRNLLGSILRDEWGYDGVVVSDWGAIHDRSASLRAGMDLEMPGTSGKGAFDEEVLGELADEKKERAAAIADYDVVDDDDDVERQRRRRSDDDDGGTAADETELETAIDGCATRVVRLIDDLRRNKKKNTTTKGRDVETAASAFASDEDLFVRHDRLAREIARECIVLLQNRDGLLPLSRDDDVERAEPSSSSSRRRIGLVGEFARGSPRYQGMGSAFVTPSKLTSLHDALRTFLGNDDGDGDGKKEDALSSSSSSSVIPFARGYDPDDTDEEAVDLELIEEAVCVARDSDVVVACVGLPEILESEGFDRSRTGLPRQHVALVEALTAVHPNVVVVLSHGGIVDVPESFVTGAKAILDGFLLGQAGGPAIVDVLFGVVSPTGRLPETIPIDPDRSVPSSSYFPGTKTTVEYREGLDVGYRYYDSEEIPVRFPFGHGLTYATFEYRNLSTTVEVDEVDAKRVKVTLDVRNAGSFSKPVSEVVQLYVRPIGSRVHRPFQELKDFRKIEIAPGATEPIEFVLDERCFSFWDVGRGDWIVEKKGDDDGDDEIEFEVRIGASSRDVRLTETVRFRTGREASDLARSTYPPRRRIHGGASSTAGGVDDLQPRPYVVDDETFFARFIGDRGTPTSTRTASESLAIGDEREKEEASAAGGGGGVETTKTVVITRNTLIVDAARLSRIGNLLLWAGYAIARREVKEGPARERELRMIRANLENTPLRSLAAFSQGALSFRILDVLIHLMNGEIGRAVTRLLSRRGRRRRRRRSGRQR